MMSLVLAGFRAYKKSRLAVCEVVARLNNLLEESVSDGRFATFFYALLSTEKKQITFTNAGHNPPYLFAKMGRLRNLQAVASFLDSCPIKFIPIIKYLLTKVTCYLVILMG